MGKAEDARENRKISFILLKTREFLTRNSLVFGICTEILAEKRKLLSRIIRLLAEIQTLLACFKNLLSDRLKTCQEGSNKDKTPAELAVPAAAHQAYRGKARGSEASAAAHPVPVGIVRLAVPAAARRACRGKARGSEASAAAHPVPVGIVRLAVPAAADRQASRGKVLASEASAAVHPVPAELARLAVPVAAARQACRGKVLASGASAAVRLVPAELVRLAVPVASARRACRGKARGSEASAAVPEGKSHETREPVGLSPDREVGETFLGWNAAHKIHSSKNLLIFTLNILFFLEPRGH
ncbi:hypothetical protein [Fictibacillus fluitans]|uniref:Uncharacterized protein n=1 Tax=Fictibacillus fluitans TaxID=3058422 RepID=A0ABT8HUX6_9BACL|nr:hypothetical protein [Fictibacillus sp. NE201]MDN4524556.1 hypothetical protein [Fictibacillus sp. NE201]